MRNPSDQKMKFVVLGKTDCRWCQFVKALFLQNHIDFTYYNIDNRPDLKNFVLDSGLKTVPQVFVNGDRIGGFEETEAYINHNWPSVESL